MAGGHEHGATAGVDRSKGRGRRLLIALALNLGITIAEVVGGVVSGSLALLADAAHNFSDAGSVLVSYIAWRISRRQADARLTFGYARAETVGAMINLTILFVIALYLAYEAVSRFFSDGEVQGTAMLIVGVIALIEDAVAAWVLRKDLGSLNVRSTFIHMVADALATVAVIVGAVAIMLWQVSWVDPLLTLAISAYIFWHAWREIRKAIAVLMDSAPEGFDIRALADRLEALDGVEGVHHLHVWRRSEHSLAVEVHLVTSLPTLAEATEMKEAARRMLREDFGVDHSTLEIEAAGGTDHDPALIHGHG